MNEQDKEAFEKWFLEYPSWVVTMSRQESCSKTWQAACEFKQKEVQDLSGQLKSCIYVYEEKVSRLIAENAKLRECVEWYAVDDMVGPYARKCLDEIRVLQV